MNWRTIQLGQGLCDQDRIILDLFKDKQVQYIGNDLEFAKHLTISNDAPNLILILNNPVWCSDVVKTCRQYLNSTIDTFYIGANRYTVLGNDTNQTIETTNQHGNDYIKFLSSIVSDLGFNVVRSGTLDNDLGRYFNFVQPLTWIYGIKTTDRTH